MFGVVLPRADDEFGTGRTEHYYRNHHVIGVLQRQKTGAVPKCVLVDEEDERLGVEEEGAGVAVGVPAGTVAADEVVGRQVVHYGLERAERGG